MIDDERFALFVMLGQTAENALARLPDVVPPHALPLSSTYDLASALPDVVKVAVEASTPYQLLFVFEAYLRDLVIEVLAEDKTLDWWTKVPKDVQDEVAKVMELEETKAWMALGARDRSALLTYPQLLRIIDENWKTEFGEVIRDKSLVQEARTIAHLRNTICHMTSISDEETERIRQTMRDWFRMVAP